jgi:hypothetical protein
MTGSAAANRGNVPGATSLRNAAAKVPRCPESASRQLRRNGTASTAATEPDRTGSCRTTTAGGRNWSATKGISDAACESAAAPDFQRTRSNPMLPTKLVFRWPILRLKDMWNQPYLETCCRAALHRLHLCGEVGRPAAMLDAPCLDRLTAMDLCGLRADGRFIITAEGVQRHANEILKRPTEATTRAWSC